jgi:hypothetical protein
VSAVAYHLSAYDSYERTGEERWSLRTGTSASAPIIAGVEALSTGYARSLGAQVFYVAGPKGSLFDITKGSNGSCSYDEDASYLCTAEVGYDGPSGWGSPDGALDLAAPSATTEAASTVKGTQAVLNGTVDPNGLDTHYDFEYGTTTSYGTTIPLSAEDIGSGTANVSVQQAVSGLLQGTTYHFRLVASSAAGTVDGVDHTFTTLAAPEFLHEDKEVVKKGFTDKGSKFQLTASGLVFTCTKSAGTGEIKGTKQVGNVFMTYTGCGSKDGEEECPFHSQGAPAGTVQTSELSGELGEVEESESATGVGLVLRAVSGTFATLEGPCIATTIVTGGIMGEVGSVDEPGKTGELIYKTTSGRQKIQKFVEMPREVLKAWGLAEVQEAVDDAVKYEETVEVT